MLVSGKDYCVGCGEKDPAMVLAQQVETLERARIHRATRNIKKTRTNLILLAITELILVLLPVLLSTSNLLSGEKGLFNFLWPNLDSTLGILFSVCMYMMLPIAVLVLVLIVMQIRNLCGYCRDRKQMQVTEGNDNKDVATLTEMVEVLERDCAERMTRTIKKTKTNLTLVGVIAFLLIAPVFFCIGIWIYRSGWSDGFKAYVTEQGCNWDALIDTLLNLVYALLPFMFLLLVSARMQLRSLRGYQDESEHLGLTRNGEHIEK